VLGAAPATPGFWDWSPDPPLALLVALAALYRIGGRRTFTPARTAPSQRRRSAAFYAALLVLAIALASPLDKLSEELFWAHMVQHVLLMLVAAPLLVVGRPWIRLWRSLPLSARRRLASTFLHGRRAAVLRAISRTLGSPAAGLALFSAVLLAWHVPALFDATLSSGALHALEHTLFFATAVLLFKQVIDSAPLRARMNDTQRLLYVVAAMTVSWVLAVVLALAPSPLYPHYAQLASRPGGISALADQQLAAGVMWVPGSITFMIIIFVYVHRWLAPQAPGPTSSRPPAGPGGRELGGANA
jgi:cytochrome c oxidase assembly factor CtaG